MKFITPYDDENMVYDFKFHRYRLTPECVTKRLGTNLSLVLNDVGDAQPSTLPQRVLDRISSHLYRYIYSKSMNKAQVEFNLACRQDTREMLEECMINEVAFVLRNGDFWNSLEEYSKNIDISKDTEMQLREEMIDGWSAVNCAFGIEYPFAWHEGY